MLVVLAHPFFDAIFFYAVLEKMSKTNNNFRFDTLTSVVILYYII